MNWTFIILSRGCYDIHFDGEYGYWEKCELINKTYFYNLTKNGECIYYHLIRKA